MNGFDDDITELDKLFGYKPPKKPKPPVNQTALSQSELEDVLRQAGWDEKNIPRMSAIGMAESALTPDGRAKVNSYNPGFGKGGRPTPEKSAGLWQVNTLAHPEYDKNKLLTDPVYNAKAALDIFAKKKQGFKAWGAYTDGRYKKFFKGAPLRANATPDVDLDSLDKLFGYGQNAPAPEIDIAATDKLFGYQPAPDTPRQSQPVPSQPLPPGINPAEIISQPVPETRQTQDLQIESARDPNVKSRMGVLLNPQEVPDARDPKWQGFQAFKYDPERFIMVNTAQAKKAKLRNAKDIQQFIDVNKPAANKLFLGIVDTVDNTGGGQPVVTAQVGGKEAASAVVTDEEKAQHQADVYREQFPQAEIGLTTTDDIAKQREQPDMPAAPEQVATDADFLAANEYLKSVGQPELTREQFNAAQKGNFQAQATEYQTKPELPQQAQGRGQASVPRRTETQVTAPALTASQGGVARPTSDPEPKVIDQDIRISAGQEPRAAMKEATITMLQSSGYDVSGEDIETAWAKSAGDTWDDDRLAAIQKSGGILPYRLSKEFVRDVLKAKANRLSTEAKRGEADQVFNVLKSQIPTELVGADRDLEEFRRRGLADAEVGLLKREDADKAYEQLKKDIETWRNNRGFLGSWRKIGESWLGESDQPSGWNQEEWAQLQRFFGGRPDTGNMRVSESYQPSGLGEEVKTPQDYLDKAYADMKKQYGNATNWVTAQREFKKRYENAPMTYMANQVGSAVTGAAKVPFQGAASILKTIAIASETVERATGGVAGDPNDPSADKKATYKLGEDLEAIAKSISIADKDFEGGVMDMGGNIAGQVITQTFLGMATGGLAAPLVFGASMGAADAYDRAKAANATPWERLGAAYVGAIATMPDYFILKGILKPASAIGKISFLQKAKTAIQNSLVKKGLVAPVAEKAAVRAVDGMFAELAKQQGWKGILGRSAQSGTRRVVLGGAEGGQESSEGVFNDLYAYFTYDPSIERWNKATTVTGERWVEGVAGFFGGFLGASFADLNARANGLTPEAAEQASNYLEQIKDDLPTETYENASKALAKAIVPKPGTQTVQPATQARKSTEGVSATPQTIDTKAERVDSVDTSVMPGIGVNAQGETTYNGETERRLTERTEREKNLNLSPQTLREEMRRQGRNVAKDEFNDIADDRDAMLAEYRKMQPKGKDAAPEPQEKGFEVVEDAAKLFHVSDNPNLTLNKDHKPSQGQMGMGFYTTSNPEVWQSGQIGDRPYVYEVDSSNLNIAKDKDRPSRQELADWGVANGYYTKGTIRRPDGSVVRNLDDDGDLQGLIETDKFNKEAAKYQDPMTGSRMAFLEQAYLKDKGFDGAEAVYSPDGHQINIFNFDKITLKRTDSSKAIPTASVAAKPLPRGDAARELPQVETTGEVGNDARVVKSRPRLSQTERAKIVKGAARRGLSEEQGNKIADAYVGTISLAKPAPQEPQAKQPHEMTRKEWADTATVSRTAAGKWKIEWNGVSVQQFAEWANTPEEALEKYHAREVREELDNKRNPVPAEVLAEYPELAKKYAKTPPLQTEAKVSTPELKSKFVPPEPPSEPKQEQDEDSKKFSRHYERVKSQFDDAMGQTYDPIEIQDQAQKAFDLIKKNRPEAMRIVYGISKPPQGVMRSAVGIMMSQSLREAGKTTQAQTVARLTSLQFTEAAQELNIAKLDLGDPMRIERSIERARLAKLGKSIFLKDKDALEQGRKKVTRRATAAASTVSSDAANLQSAEDLLKLLTC